MAKKRLGELLMERGLIDNDQLNSALGYQRQWGYRLGTVLVLKGFVSEGTLTRVLSESLQVPMVDLSKVPIDHKALALVKSNTAEEYDVLPIAVKTHQGRKTLLLAMADPLNVAAIDEIAFTTDMAVRPAIAQLSSLEAAIKRYYRNQRVDIPPLNFGAPTVKRSHVDTGEDDEDKMVITVGGSEREIKVQEGESAIVDLSKPPPADGAQRWHNQAQQQFQGGDFFKDAPTGAYMMAVPQAQPTGNHAFTPQQTGSHAFTPQQTGSHAFTPQSTGSHAFTPRTTGNFNQPFAQQPTATHNVSSMQSYQPQATGTHTAPTVPPGGLSETTDLEQLEQKFWALMRILARKGLITKEEFLRELKQD